MFTWCGVCPLYFIRNTSSLPIELPHCLHRKTDKGSIINYKGQLIFFPNVIVIVLVATAITYSNHRLAGLTCGKASSSLRASFSAQWPNYMNINPLVKKKH